MDSDLQAQSRKRKGPYQRYLYIPEVDIPKSTSYRIRKAAKLDHIGDQGQSPCSHAAAPVQDSDELYFCQDHFSEEACEEDFNAGCDEDELPADDPLMFPQHDTEPDLSEDEDEDTEQHADQEPLFTGSRLNVASSMLLIMTFVMRHSLTVEALCDLLVLLELHCLSPNLFISSIKTFKQYFSDLKSPLEFHYYCEFCSHYLGTTKPEVCGICQVKQGNSSFFIILPLLPQLQKIVTEFLSVIDTYRTEVQSHRNEIRDVMNGRLYQELFDGSHFRGTVEDDKETEIHLSLQLNTDGVSVFKSSKFAIWPVYSTVNELSPQLRFTRSCRLFGGLWFGTAKPDMKIFVRPYVDQLKALFNEGFRTQMGSTVKTVRAVLLSAVFDAPARCSIQDFIQFNGFFGCATCYAEGESASTGKGSTHVYPFDMTRENKKNGHPSIPTHQETVKLAQGAAREERTIKGVKGYSWLLKIPQFNVIRGVGIDYMHCVLLGVMKMMLKLWTKPAHKKEVYYIGDKVCEMDKRLASLSPPNCVSRLPRSLKDLGHWKASELRSFLLFYSIPVLFGILPQEHFEHFLYLVHGISILLPSSITRNELKQARRQLHSFCLMFDCMYGKRYESFNVHSLLHLHQKVSDLGPLWAQSCFFYEDLNSDIRKLFHGTQKIELQIVNSHQYSAEATRAHQPPGVQS